MNAVSPHTPPRATALPPQNAFVLGLLVLAVLWIVARPLAGQFNPYSPENGFANAIVLLFGLCAAAAAWLAKPRIVWPERLSVALLLYAGVMAWGLVRSPHKGQGVALFGEALSYIVLLGGGFVLARVAPGSGAVLARAALAAVATQAFAGVWQHFVDLPHLWSSARSGELFIPEELASTAGQYRLYGTDVFGSFGNPNSLAAYLLVGGGLLVGFAIQFFHGGTEKARDAILPVDAEGPAARRGRIALGAATGLLLLAALAWTHSKGAWVAAAALIWFAALHCVLQRAPHRRKRLLALTLAGVAVMALVLLLGYWNVLPMPESLRVRFEYWRAAGAMISANPFSGVGLGGFAEHYSYYKTPLGTETRDAHNDYLHFWAELGVFSVPVYLGLWWILLRGGEPLEQKVTAVFDARRERTVLATGASGFLLMYLGFQPLNSGEFFNVLAGAIHTYTLAGIISSLVMPAIFLAVFHFSRGLRSAGAWRGFGCAAGAILIHQMVDFDFKAPAVLGSLFLLGGAFLGERTEAKPPTLRQHAPLVLLPVFVLALAPLGVWYPFASGIARKNASVLEEELRPAASKEESLQREERAYIQKAFIEARKLAAERAPFDGQAWSDYADALRVQFQNARYPEALESILQKVQQQRPFAAAPYIQHANFNMQRAQAGHALDFASAPLDAPVYRYARAAERYPLHPGIPLWAGDAQLLMRRVPLAAAEYNKALSIDRQIVDANVRLSACFSDPMAGAFPRHGKDAEVLAVLQQVLTDRKLPPDVQRALQLRRVLGLAGAIRALERAGRKGDAGAIQKLRAELARAAETLPSFFSDSGNKAHAALLTAMSYELSGATGRAAAWSRARDLHEKSIEEGSAGTPARLFNALESHFSRK